MEGIGTHFVEGRRGSGLELEQRIMRCANRLPGVRFLWRLLGLVWNRGHLSPLLKSQSRMSRCVLQCRCTVPPRLGSPSHSARFSTVVFLPNIVFHGCACGGRGAEGTRYKVQTAATETVPGQAVCAPNDVLFPNPTPTPSPPPLQTQSKEWNIAMFLNSECACNIAEMWPRPMMEELPNIAAYAYQDVHVWSAL